MLVRLSRVLLTTAVAVLVGAGAMWAQEAQKQWKDRAEYDLYESITKATDNNKKLELLESWSQKYPGSDFKIERLQLYLDTYQALNRVERVMEVGSQILAEDPKNLRTLYIMTLNAPRMTTPTPQLLDTADKAARTLVANSDEFFAADKRPATTPQAEWDKGKRDTNALAHMTLGWVAMQRKQNEAAEKEFVSSLELNPENAQVSYWLGNVLLTQKVPEKQSQALYHFARAAAYDGQGALTPQGRKDLDAYLTKVYSTYHGSRDGLDELRQTARARALPPPDFRIMSAAEAAIAKEEQFRRENPMLALWLSVKKELTGPNGEQYWESSVQRAALPGGVSGVSKFRGTLISARPPKNPKELVLGISDPSTPEVTLQMDQPLKAVPKPGSEIAFAGVAMEFSREPFMITFSVERGDVEGLP